MPPFPLRRVQWWFQLTQQGDSTKLVQEVEVDLGEAAEQFGGVETFIAGRGAALAEGIKKTLENVKSAAEREPPVLVPNRTAGSNRDSV